MALDGGYVGADRNIAAVLGAALADVQPASVVELGLESAGAGIALAFAGGVLAGRPGAELPALLRPAATISS